MIDELPQGWCDAGITEVAEVFLGKTPARTDYASSGSLKVVKFRDIHDGRVDFSNAKDGFVRNNGDALSSLRELRPGDVLITSAAHSGENIGKKCAYVSSLPDQFSRVFFTGELLNIRCLDDTLSRWAYLFFRSIDGFSEIQEAVTGVHLTGGRAMQMRIPVAPLPEQRRILRKLEKLLEKVDACQQRLAKIPALLKRFRQSVLAAACSGRLTADWREERPPSDIAEENELPPGWQRKTVEELIPKGGIFDGPFGSNLKSDDYTKSGVRVIRLENIGQLRFIGEKETFISREKYETLKKHTVDEGDIIFASFIADEVRACVLPKLSTKAIAKADCFCLRPKPELVDRQYLVFQLISQKSYNTLVEEVHGATRPRINTTQLRKLEVRVCPLPEQREIVRRVEALFALADQIEARYAKAKAYVEKLTPSLLVRAFRGELVPQDPNDEPASVLLERIRSQRQRGNGANRKRKRATLAAV